jgi:hypothetical protein
MDPAHQLRLLDLHFAMRWQAWRMLEDFWGTTGGSADTPYFVRAAETYLASARLLDKTPRRLLHGSDDLESLLKTRRDAVRATALTVRDALSLKTDVAVPHELQVQWHAAVPEGIAAAFLARPSQGAETPELLAVRDPTGQFLLRRYPLRAPNQGSPASAKYQIPLSDLKSTSAGADLDAVCLYRGHVAQQRFRILWPPWVARVEVPPRNPTHASITVEGEGQKTGHIMFVFDCSGSMQERAKMRVAKHSLQSVLGSLLAAGRYEVGLRAYGRRAKFTDPNDCSKKAFVNPDDPIRVHPDLDVELMSPIQTLDREHHASLLAKFTDLQPFGQTPLYLALKTAFSEGDFDHVPQGEPKRLIVITDGLNFQTNCLRIENRPERPTSMPEVLAARQAAGAARDVQVDIIGLDMDETRDQLSELIHLAEQTGGRYYDAKNTENLIQALRQALSLIEYTVSGPNAEAEGRTRRELGETWPLPQLPPKPARYEVELIGTGRDLRAAAQIEGGEAVLMQYDPRRGRLFFPPYEPKKFDPMDDLRGEPQTCQASDGSGVYRVQTLLPRRQVKDVEFYVSVQQRDDQKFTVRPKHVWAEIRPLGLESQRVYHFVDPDFVPQRPVPVFRFLAKDWPAAVEEAEIRLWFHTDPQAAQPDWTGPVADPARKGSFEVASLPGAEFEISSQALGEGATSVVVTERHPMDRPVNLARVRIYPPPDEMIVHEFAGLVNVGKHEFRYAQPTLATVDITSQEKIIDGAVEVPPMRVVVPK